MIVECPCGSSRQCFLKYIYGVLRPSYYYILKLFLVNIDMMVRIQLDLKIIKN